jgi:hypothetical protein
MKQFYLCWFGVLEFIGTYLDGYSQIDNFEFVIDSDNFTNSNVVLEKKHTAWKNTSNRTCFKYYSTVSI